MKEPAINHKNIYYPPGGILLWIIIYLELRTFGIALVAMVYYGKQEPEIFHDSRLLLNSTYGMSNTIFLLTSSFFMAASVNELKSDNRQRAQQHLLLAVLFGLLFLGLKSVEYYDNVEAGFWVGHSSFFSYYWILTLFHSTHVLVGLVILISIYFGFKKEKSTPKIENIEASAAFWHMCNLIWLLVFPVIYLLF